MNSFMNDPSLTQLVSAYFLATSLMCIVLWHILDSLEEVLFRHWKKIVSAAMLVAVCGMVFGCGRDDRRNFRTFVENTQVKPAKVDVPAGSLSLPGDITVTETDPFMTDTAKTVLLNDAPYTDATKPILVSAEHKQDTVIPMTISITLNSAQLALFAEGNLKVVYNTFDASADKDDWGLFEGDQLVVVADTVMFRTKHFGHFQGISVK